MLNAANPFTQTARTTKPSGSSMTLSAKRTMRGLAATASSSASRQLNAPHESKFTGNDLKDLVYYRPSAPMTLDRKLTSAHLLLTQRDRSDGAERAQAAATASLSATERELFASVARTQRSVRDDV
jgi:hypothetical protein